MDRLVPSMATKAGFTNTSSHLAAPRGRPNRAQATQSVVYCAISMAYAKRERMGNPKWHGTHLRRRSTVGWGARPTLWERAWCGSNTSEPMKSPS